jgi:hypothetical protein
MSRENRAMSDRFVAFVSLIGMATALLALLPTPASAASPWWQLLTGSRPTTLWEPTDNVQKIKTESTELIVEGTPTGQVGAAAQVLLGGETVACMGTKNLVGEGLCPGFYGFPVTETAAELQAVLEAATGATVEVSGGPVGGQPFIVTFPGRGAPTIRFHQEPKYSTAGNFSTEVLSSGGSGRLTLSVTNLGDAEANATKTPVKIEDELPEGVTATEVVGFAGAQHAPLGCALDSQTHLTCTFKGILPSYEALEAEVFVNLAGEPPVAGKPGTVSVSGAGAPPVSAAQPIKVGPDPTPFGIEHFSAVVEEEGGSPAVQAGSHPFQLTTTVQANSGPATGVAGGLSVQQPGLVRNLRFPLPAGLVGNVSAVPQCSMTDFFAPRSEIANRCPDATAVGAVNLSFIQPGVLNYVRAAQPVFDLAPGEGEPARFGFTVAGNPVVINTAVDPDDEYRIIASVNNTTQVIDFLSSTLVLWGAPGDPLHDSTRGWGCVFNIKDVGPCERPASLSETAFLRQPVACSGSLGFEMQMEPWNAPVGTALDSASFSAEGMRGCNQVPFNPTIGASSTSRLAGNPSGLDFRLDMPNAGLLNKDAIAEGQAKKVEVTLPEGMTVNPSEGEGLAGCSPEQYARETASSKPGEGCPEASKIGTVQIATPLLKEELQGALYVATPFDNPFGSLIGLYLVAKIPDRGIVVKQAGVVRPDPVTGQLTSTFDDVPQFPITTFKLHFKEGGRAPLVTPPACGGYEVLARFTPWSAVDPDNPTPAEIVTRTDSFGIERGVDGGACPSGGTPPFHPGLLAGTINNAAGKYSPFDVRLTRNDGEQEFTNFSIKLPPGVVGKLAGIPFCSDAAIAAAKARTGPNGGQEELENPSCPAASQVGRTLVGAGVGASLTYVPGKVYLAGPYHGSPLSVVSITAAKVGPFDLGTVVIRVALRINPETAEVFIDATGSDPIPHIIQGIPVHARDIRVYVDRNQFVLNPTSCERTSTASTVLGSGLDFGSAADDVPVTVTSPFQAADCASLGFKPRLVLKLRGKTNRGGNPALRAVLRPRHDDANPARISVALPHSEFLDQGHIRTVCTRVQFKAGAGNGAECPSGAIYGHAKAWTPLFDKPLEGPILLRSSEHPLPDMVLALHGLVDIDAVGRIDSVKGGIRNTFDFVPDAPITKVVVDLQGGDKGLLENSTDICRGKHRATVKMKGHNGRIHNFLAPLEPKCPRKHARRHR